MAGQAEQLDPFALDLSTPLDDVISSTVDDDEASDLSSLDRGDEITVDEEDLEVLPSETEEKDTPDETEASTKTEEEAEAPQQEEEEDEPAPTESIMVPKARLDQVSARNRVLAEENKALLERLEQVIKGAEAPQTPEPEPEPEPEPQFDFAAKQKEEYDAILDGNTEKALAIRQEIDTAREELYTKRAVETASQTLTSAQETTLFNRTVEALSDRFPVFNPQNEAFDEALTTEVVALRDSLVNGRGLSRSQALVEATKYVLAAKRPELLQAQQDKGNTTKPTDKEKPRNPTQEKVVAQQPSDLAGDGNADRDTGKVDVLQMTEEEFDALPEATKRRLRGD